RERIAHGSVHLRGAAEAVGVLHTLVFFGRTMRFADFAAFVEMSEVSSCAACSGIGPGVHDAGIERAGASAKGVERKRGGYVGGMGEGGGFAEGEAQKGQHALCAVKQRKAFFGFEGDRSDVGAAESFAAGQALPAKLGRAFADDHVCEMRERRKIARGADR